MILPDGAAPAVENTVVPADAASDSAGPGADSSFVYHNSDIAAVFHIGDTAGPPASVDIASVFAVSVPASGIAVEVGSPERPSYFAFPNIVYYASSSSSVEVYGQESFHSSSGVRSSYGLCNNLSIQG